MNNLSATRTTPPPPFPPVPGYWMVALLREKVQYFFCKAKIQYLLTLQVSRYCLLALRRCIQQTQTMKQASTPQGQKAVSAYFTSKQTSVSWLCTLESCHAHLGPDRIISKCPRKYKQILCRDFRQFTGYNSLHVQSLFWCADCRFSLTTSCW